MTKAGINIDKPTLFVEHAKLKKVSKDSAYQSFCPACKEGWLLVRRENKTPYHLMNDDRCSLCGQAVHYTDLNKIFTPIGNPIIS